MGTDTSTIRHEVEETRERMGDTVEALAYKADVPARARESVHEKVDAMKSKVTGVVSSANDATPSTGDVRHGAGQAVGAAQENPLGLAIGAIAVGFLGGMLLPVSRVEREQLQPVGQQVREVAETAAEHGKQAAQDAAGAVKDAAGDAVTAAKEAADDAVAAAKESADDAVTSVKETGAEHAQKVQEEVSGTSNGQGSAQPSGPNPSGPGLVPPGA